MQETAEIINDAEMSGILSDLLGMDVVKMLPDRVRAVTKLAAFSKGGKISKERVNLFRDVFGEIDAEAIATIMKYGDMAAKKGAGILFEDAEVETNLTEAEQESAEVLRLLSTEVGTVFYVTDQFETGTYLSANMMAVKKGDLAGGVFASATHRAYYMAKQMMADRGIDFKAFLLGEAKRLKGEAFVEEQIKTILRQSAENGNDISRVTAENELCARLLGELLQQDGVLEKLAESNIESVAALRKALAVVEEHLLETQKQQKNTSIKEDLSANKDLLDSMEIVAKVDEERQFKSKQDVVDWAESLFEELDFKVERANFGVVIIDRKRISGGVRYFKTNEERLALVALPYVLKSGVEITRHPKHKGRDYDTVTIAAPILMNGQRVNMGVVVRIEGLNYYKVHRIVYTESTDIDNKKRDDAERAGGVENNSGLSPADIVSKNSIPNSSENVNTDSEISFFDGGSEKVTDLVDRMTALINGEKESVEQTDADPDRDPTYTDADQVRAENGGADSARNFEDMTPEERAAEIADLQSEIDAIMTEDIQKQLEREEGERKSGAEGTVDRVGAHKGQKKDPPGKWIGDSWNWIRRRMVDSGQAIYDIGKKIKDDYLYAYYNMARAAQQAGVTMISKWQTDVTGKVVGKSLQEIWAPIKDQGTEYAKQFDLYLLHLHNIDRMSRYDPEALAEARHQYEVEKAYLSEELQKMSDNEIRAISHDRDSAFVGEARDYINALDNYNRIRNVKDKPVFGYDVSAEDSRGAVEDLERRYPEFKEYREAVYQYVDNLLQYRVDSGLISVETKAMLKKTYPHYVPTARVQAEDAPAKKHWWQREKNREQTNKVIGKAKGGDQKILSLYDQIAGQTMSVVREGSKNRLGVRLLDLVQGEILPHTNSKETKRLSKSDLPDYLDAGNRKNKQKVEALKKGFNLILDGENQIKKYISDAIDEKTENITVAYGVVNDELANDVSLYSSGKIEVDGYYLELVPNDLQHAYKEHHKAKEDGDIDLSREDFKNIPHYLDNYDELVYAIQYKSGNKRICVRKKLTNGRVLIIETVSKSRGALQLKNVIGVTEEKYIREYKKYKRSSPNTGGGDSLNISPHDRSASANIKTQDQSKVNIPQIKRVGKYADKLTDPLLIDRHLDEIDPFMTVNQGTVL